jgi:hypothetical protein
MKWEEVEKAARAAVELWAEEYLKAPYRAQGSFLQWNSDEEVYLGTTVYKGHKKLGVVMTIVITPATIKEQLGDEIRGGPGTHEENLDWVYRWLRSDGDMGHSPLEMLQDEAQESAFLPKTAFRSTL